MAKLNKAEDDKRAMTKRISDLEETVAKLEKANQVVNQKRKRDAQDIEGLRSVCLMLNLLLHF